MKHATLALTLATLTTPAYAHGPHGPVSALDHGLVHGLPVVVVVLALVAVVRWMKA